MYMLSPSESLLVFLSKTLDESDKNKIEGRTKLQKIVYLSSRTDDVFNFSFIGYHYGPYSRELQKTITKMIAFNLIDEEEEGINHNTRYNYRLTSEGIKKAEEIWKKTEKGLQERIEKLAITGKELNENSFKDVLNQAYATATDEGIL